MTKEGLVSKTDEGMATVLVKTQNACDACRAECGGHCDKARLEKITAENSVGAAVGDRVVLYSDTSTVMLWACLVFVIPIIVCFATVLIASAYISSPIVIAIIALCVLVGIFAILRFAFRSKKQSDVFKIIKIIKGEENESY